MMAKTITKNKKQNIVIAIRTDSQLLEKIRTLEKIEERNRSEIIKEAVARSFNEVIFNNINSKIYEELRRVFRKVDLDMFGTRGISNNESPKKNKNPFDKDPRDQVAESSTAFYKLDFSNYVIKRKKIDFCLSDLNISVEVKPLDMIKIKFIQSGIISGNLEKIEPNLLKKITQIIIKEKFKLEAKSSGDKIEYSLFFERNVNRCKYSEWKDKFNKDLKKVKKILSSISLLLEKEKEVKKVKKQ
jgi:hypothetical protein